MTTQEAIEIVTHKRPGSHDEWASADYAIRKAYLAEHDPRPLTLELCKELLGKPLNIENGHYAFWQFCGYDVWFRFNEPSLIFDSFKIKSATIGQLRRLVGVLRGEV